MSRLPLRYQMTLLYSLLTALLCTCLLVGLYFTVQQSLMRSQEDLLSLAYDQLTALIEMKNGRYVVEEDELKLPSTAAYLVLDPAGQTLSAHRMPAALAQEPFTPGKMRGVEIGEAHWLLLDNVEQQDAFSMQIRTALSLEDVDRPLRAIKSIALVSLPLLLLAATLGGLFVARRSLQPIDRIIGTAQIVAQGDLSERIQGTDTRDEVGELARTMNDMLDKLEASFQREKRFASDASHELRTPVSIMLAYAESLAQELTGDSDAARSIQTILAESHRMQRIISQLLTITRSDAGKYIPERAPVDISEVAKTVVEQMAPLAQEKSITLDVDAQADTQIIGDQSLLTQMMINLVENAIKYGKADGRVDIRIARWENRCRITVADDGLGIPGESLPHIFERFYRADAARDRSGTGLGLAIVHWIVPVHHGEIVVNSQAGVGTAFTITLG